MRAAEVDLRNERTTTNRVLLVHRGIPLHGIDLHQTGIAHPTPLVFLHAPHMHLNQATGQPLRLICTILPVVQSILSSLCAGRLMPTSAPTLVRVAIARGRVLCPECRGENDDMFHFSQ